MSVKKIHNSGFSKMELYLLTFVFKHYKEEFNARHLASLLEINHAHCYKLCRQLEKKELLTMTGRGSLSFYSFPYYSQRATRFMEYVLFLEAMSVPPDLKMLLYVLRKFSDFVDITLLFGSVVHKKGYKDIDVLLVYDKKQKQLVAQTKRAILKEGLLERPIRYVDLTPEDLQKNKEEVVLYQALSENIVLGDPEKYIEAIVWLTSTNT